MFEKLPPDFMLKVSHLVAKDKETLYRFKQIYRYIQHGKDIDDEFVEESLNNTMVLTD